MVIKIEIKAEQEPNNSISVGQVLNKDNQTAGEIAFIIAELERTKLELLNIEHGIVDPMRRKAPPKRLHNVFDIEE